MLTDPAVPFSIEQLEALMTWSEGGPLGVSIASDNDKLPEVAEFWRQDTTLPAYRAFARQSGVVEVEEDYSAEWWSWHGRDLQPTMVTDVRAAIAWVEERERAALERNAGLILA